MSLLLGRFGFGLAVIGVALGAFPKKAMAHCRPAPTQSTSSHHDHSRKNTDSAAECPHCPPAECRRHAECATTLDSVLVGGSAVPAVGLGAPLVSATVSQALSGHLSPPTPPPQPTL